MSDKISRRSLLLTIGIALNGMVALAIAVPVVEYLLSPVRRGKDSYNRWISLGKLDQFPAGQTRLATFTNPFKKPQDGVTADTPCWVRHMTGNKFQVFAINCAHLDCPVRWFPQSELFMCPCHGGVYYADGSRASGPPERGLFEYQYKVDNGELHIDAGQLPTLSTDARLVTIQGAGPCGGSPCQG